MTTPNFQLPTPNGNHEGTKTVFMPFDLFVSFVVP